MWEYTLGVSAALWLGVLTSISPCPLATNIAAISYIGRRVDSPRLVFLSGLLYALGRTLAYVALGALIVTSVLSSPPAARFLQRHMNELLGPVLILVGMLLLGLIRLNIAGMGMSEKMQQRIDALGVFGAFVLGVVFALAFCPVSAGLFFASLMPSVKTGSSLVLPAVFGVGTALPVVFFAVLIAAGAQSVGKAYNVLSKIEWWARHVTGVIFLLTGVYFSLVHIFGLTLQLSL